MDTGQVKGTMGKFEKGMKGKGKEKGKREKGNSDAKGNAWTDDSYFADKCGYCGKWRQKKAQCQKQKKDQGSKPLSCNSSSSCNDVLDPIVLRKRRLTLDIRCERIGWAKRTILG